MSIIIVILMANTELTVKTNNLIQEGDPLLMWFEDETTYLVTIQKDKKFGIHCGKPVLLGDLIGKPYGSWLETTSNVRALLLEPTVEDFVMKAKRESGIIYPKDAAILMMKCGIRSGSRVIEVGAGSGSLTTALAAQVAPNGKIYTYDIREDFLKLTEGNLKKARLAQMVELIKREGAEPFRETDVDAIILDVPEPWHEVPHIKTSLKSGGRLASLNPTYNQIERMAGELNENGFIMVEALEVLVRGILARPGKTRPEQRMVSHTEFMLFAVKPGEHTIQGNPPAKDTLTGVQD